MGATQWAREYRAVTSGPTTMYIKQYTATKAYNIILNSIKKP